jgi:hypothetical protein
MCVAINQTRLVFTESLSPWSGGGFGMFSTTDAATDRHLHVYQVTSRLRRELNLPAELDDAVRRALTLPSERQLRMLAALLTEHLGRVSNRSIEIQVWSNHYETADLRPQSRVLRFYRADEIAKH